MTVHDEKTEAATKFFSLKNTFSSFITGTHYNENMLTNPLILLQSKSRQSL